MTIQAIETRYRGYRFRSRLEARWAVFFDKMGYLWEYEPQGFDLGGALGNYLPDFYIRDLNAWIEVKGEHLYQEMMKEYSLFYFAGKINKNCWRHSLVPGLRGSLCMRDNIEDWPILRIGGRMSGYIGPYFASCDHGCAHGSGEHGMSASSLVDCVEVPKSLHHDMPDDWQNRVQHLCLKAIDDSEKVFIWIDSLDCYGTLVEAGYAYARGKDIRVGVDVNLRGEITKADNYGYDNNNDLWFLLRLSNNWIYGNSARAAFNDLYPVTNAERDILKILKVSSEQQAKFAAVYGDPLCRQWFANLGDRGWWLSGLFDDAAEAARSARFEHGEVPA